MTSTKIVIGLGNPGKEYQWTRHNMGALVVNEFLALHGGLLRAEKELCAMVAKGVLGNQSYVVAVPRLYMNECGAAVGRILRYFQVESSSLMIVVDDIETPFGHFSKVYDGGTRGHKGLKSIKNVLGSMEWTQLRMGVSRPDNDDVATYVLESFTLEQRGELPSILTQAAQSIEQWVVGEE